jgi:drug/metabolite transporter (DMT)-like permease
LIGKARDEQRNPRHTSTLERDRIRLPSGRVAREDRTVAIPEPASRRVLTTAEGTRAHAFGATEWGLLAIPALIWGCSFLLIAVGVTDLAPATLTMLRIAFGALAIGAIPAARRKVPREALPAILALSITWMALPFYCFSVAEQWIDSSLAGMLNGAMPLATAALSTLLLRRAPGPRQLVGLLVGFGGVIVVMVPVLDTGKRGSASGIALSLLAIGCYGIAANISVPLQQKYGALPVIFRAQLGALACTAPFGVAGFAGSTLAWRSLGAVALLGVFGTGVAFIAMATLLGRVGAARGSIAIYFVPVIAVLAGVLFHHEHVAGLSLLGMVLVILGAALTSRAEYSRRETLGRAR